MTKKMLSEKEFLRQKLQLTDTFTLPSRAILSPLDGIMSSAVFFTAAASLGLIDSWMPPFIGAAKDCPPKSGTLQKRFSSVLTSKLPFTLQILGNDEESLLKTSLNAYQAGIRSVNWNCGCPSATVLSSGSGGALLRNKEKIRKILQTLRRDAPQIAISIKMRCAFDSEEESEELFHAVREGAPHWIILHYRTVKERYTVLDRSVALRRFQKAREIWKEIPFFANGDIVKAQDAFFYRKETACDGVAVGRGLLQNPFMLQEICGRLQKDLRREFLEKLTENLTPRQKRFYGMECTRMIYGRDSEEFRKALEIHRGI